jgi:hypothetical protein
MAKRCNQYCQHVLKSCLEASLGLTRWACHDCDRFGVTCLYFGGLIKRLMVIQSQSRRSSEVNKLEHKKTSAVGPLTSTRADGNCFSINSMRVDDLSAQMRLPNQHAGELIGFWAATGYSSIDVYTEKQNVLPHRLCLGKIYAFKVVI